jgi:hypothetical protein
MQAATRSLHNDYRVDLSKAFSASSLAMMIFRTKFLKEPIPLISEGLDSVLRGGYRGGATQVFKERGQNLRYYDVNSLYPTAMMQPMPTQYLGKSYHWEINLDTFNGFIEARIQSIRAVPANWVRRFIFTVLKC